MVWILPSWFVLQHELLFFFPHCSASVFSFLLIPFLLITVKAFSSSSFVLLNGSRQALHPCFSWSLICGLFLSLHHRLFSSFLQICCTTVLPSLLLTFVVSPNWSYALLLCSGLACNFPSSNMAHSCFFHLSPRASITFTAFFFCSYLSTFWTQWGTMST